MRIGVDFGTTHTSAATFDGQALAFIPLDPKNVNPSLLRSMLYLTKDQETYLGFEAVERYLKDETGRSVVLTETVVGTIENTFAQQSRGPLEPDGPITIIYDAVVEHDIGARGRLLQSIKTGLRSGAYEGTHIFGRYYTLQELISLILSHVREQAESQLKTEVREVVLGRPVKLSENAIEDQAAETRLREAAQMAGFQEIAFVMEPEAAALDYVNKSQKPELVFVYDFGGGTLDFTVMRIDEARQAKIVATHGIHVGGDDLDNAIMHHQVAPCFGKGATVDVNFDGRIIPFSEDLSQYLDKWTTIPTLSQEQYLTIIERGKKYSPEKEKFMALESLVTKNYGFVLFEKIEQAKRVLSTEQVAQIRMQREAINLALDISFKDFNQSIMNEFTAVRHGMKDTLALAGVTAAEIDVVVTTGGSSVIPIFQKMLKTEFKQASFVQTDTFTSVTGGLAISAYGG